MGGNPPLSLCLIIPAINGTIDLEDISLVAKQSLQFGLLCLCDQARD